MTTLYEITGQMAELEAMLDDPDMPAEAINDTLEAIGLEWKAKAENVGKMILNIGGQLDSVTTEKLRLMSREKSLNNKQEWLKDYLRVNMAKADNKKVECALFNITRVKGRETCTVTDVLKLPDNLITVFTEVKPDKRQILEMLKAGEVVEGAELSAGKDSIRIK